MTRIVAVIAALDEEETIEALTRRLHATFQGMPDVEGEMLFVVEGRDRTREILERLSGEIPGIRILYDAEPAGLDAAFRRGFAAVPAGADVVVTLDADLNHQPEEIPASSPRCRSRAATSWWAPGFSPPARSRGRRSGNASCPGRSTG